MCRFKSCCERFCFSSLMDKTSGHGPDDVGSNPTKSIYSCSPMVKAHDRNSWYNSSNLFGNFYISVSSNGRAHDSDSCNNGSIPFTGAIFFSYIFPKYFSFFYQHPSCPLLPFSFYQVYLFCRYLYFILAISFSFYIYLIEELIIDFKSPGKGKRLAINTELSIT